MISTTTAGYRRWLHDYDDGVYFAPPYLTSASQFGGPLSFGPQPPSPKASRPILTPASLLLALKEDDNRLKPWQPGTGPTYQWDNLPEAPVPEDPNLMQPVAPPPPRSSMTNLPGYEQVGAFGESKQMPPPSMSVSSSRQPPKFNFDNSVNLSEAQVREAILSFAKERCCYGDGAAKHMEIIAVRQSTSLQYTLETYTEARSAGYKDKPYKGGDVDGPQNGAPPPAWNITCNPDHMFHNAVKKLEVPHTAVVQRCHHCQGLGFNRCYRCQGLGWVRCNHCEGNGQVCRDNMRYDYCNFCGGDGKRRCFTCNSDGRVTCNRCRGYRNLKCYIELTVIFTNHIADYKQQDAEIPEDLALSLHHVVVFEQQEQKVWPIANYSIDAVNENSSRLLEKHRSAFPNEQQLMQRQILRVSPITEVSYRWRGSIRKLCVYGRDMKVFCPDYPQACCWGCTIC